jgi:hypothetical protein
MSPLYVDRGLLAELPAIRQQLRHTPPHAAEYRLVDNCQLTSAGRRQRADMR